MDKSKEKQLKFAYWFVENKERLIKLGIIIFAVFDLILVIFGIWGFVDYFINYNKDQSALKNWATIDYQNIRHLVNPKPLQIVETTVISSGVGKYDLVAKIVNPNSTWIASEIKYKFYIDNNIYTPVQASFILAEEEKYFMVLAYESAERVKDFTVEIEGISWKNLNKIELKDVKVEISNEKLDSVTGLSHGQSNIRRLSFDVYNDSIYNLWQVGFQIVLLGSQNKIAAANYLMINNLSSFEEKKIEINLFNAPSYPREIIILPEVNIFNEDNFRKEEAGIEGGER
jgi:hypothetical protein